MERRMEFSERKEKSEKPAPPPVSPCPSPGEGQKEEISEGILDRSRWLDPQASANLSLSRLTPGFNERMDRWRLLLAARSSPPPTWIFFPPLDLPREKKRRDGPPNRSSNRAEPNRTEPNGTERAVVLEASRFAVEFELGEGMEGGAVSGDR